MPDSYQEPEDYQAEWTGNSAGAQPPEAIAAQALDAISERLHRMLNLAMLAAAEGLTVDRDALQKRLEVLRGEIDRIADSVPTEGEDSGAPPPDSGTSGHI